MGGQVRNEKAQTQMGRAADSQHPQSAAAPGAKKATSPGCSAGSGHRGQPVSGPGRGNISSCCEGEEKSLSGVAVAQAFVRVLTQVPRHLWSQCPPWGGGGGVRANCEVGPPPTNITQLLSAKIGQLSTLHHPNT